MMKFIQQKALSRAAINAGPPSPLSVKTFFFRNPFRTQTAEAKQQDGISLPYTPPPRNDFITS